MAVGRLRPGLREVADDYLRRLRRTGAVQEVEVREAAGSGSPAAEVAREAARIREALPGGATLVALDRLGQPWTSEEVARRLAKWREAARPVALVIGGPRGLDPDLLAQANARWSLGPPTLPHELARVVVLEQLYRAGTILRGEPYHRGDARER